MSSTVDDRVVVDLRASNFAFRASQMVERLLLDRGLEIARQSGSSIVTADHVGSCLDHVLLDQVLERMRESSHDETAGEGAVLDGPSREAA